MNDLGYLPFDCDNHYYEAPEDAFTRHVPKEHAVAAACSGPRSTAAAHHVVGRQAQQCGGQPDLEPHRQAGCDLGVPARQPAARTRQGAAGRPRAAAAEYIERDARIAKIDGARASRPCGCSPTLGVLYEELLKHDTDAVVRCLFRAFNRWLEEDWGCNYQDRIFASPYITLADVDFACEELEWALAQDATHRVSCGRPRCGPRSDGVRSPADPIFDPFWARVNEAGITGGRPRGRLRVHDPRLRARRLQLRGEFGQPSRPTSSTSTSSGPPTTS